MKVRFSAISGIIVVSVLYCLLLLVSVAKAAETVIYSEGFEEDNGGYILDYGNTAEWEWGTPSGVGPGGAHSGNKCWGTDLDDTLNRPAEGSIVSPAIILPAIAGNQLIRVRFWAYVAIDGMYDRGQLFVSKDKVNWESVIQLYHNMEVSPSLPSSWKKYEFTLDSRYAGGTIYLRFRAATLSGFPSFFCGGGGNLSGLYVDDIAITVFDTSGDRKLFTMQAWEDQSSWASCPWVAPWNGTTFDPDNDIFPVARFQENEFTDSYKLQKPLVARNGVYPLEIQEKESEDSFTDFVALMQIDHAADVAVASDAYGNLLAFRPAKLLPPMTAVTGQGADVVDKVSAEDTVGFPAYSGDTLLLDFGTHNSTEGAVLVLRVQGFILGTGDEKPYVGPPCILVETPDNSGVWQERGRFLPRDASAVSAFDLSPYIIPNAPVLVKLRSVSHSIKYHSIDFAGLYQGPRPQISVAQTAPVSATSGSADILGTLAVADGNYVKMSGGAKCTLEFPVLPLADGQVRDFAFVSRGYYVPLGGSYLIYTWDGTAWVMRDSYSYFGFGLTKSFDLSLFLPDPNGEYRVRVWQDYQYEPAGIDYVTFTEGALTAPLNWAWDYRSGNNIYNAVVASDNNRIDWSSCPRNRVTEYNFTPPTVPNVPPRTCPVSISSTTPQVISWAYSDAEVNPQAEAEVEIWTGPDATGTIVWDPPLFVGTETSLAYTSSPLTPGTYYARVRANDGKDWGTWCEQQFVVEAVNRPPVANPIPDQFSTYGSVFSYSFPANSFTDADLGQALSYTVSGVPSLPPGISFNGLTRTFSGTPTGVGTFSVTVTATDSGTPPLSASTSFRFNVTPAALTITAHNRTKAYGEVVTFVGTEFTASGLVSGDAVTSVGLSSSGGQASATVAGSPYAIIPASATGKGLENYTITYVNGALTVEPVVLTITAGNQSKPYGEPLPQLTGAITGLRNSDNITASFTTVATAGSAVGTYPITATLNDPEGKLANYTLSLNPGILTIDKATLTVTADDKSKVYGTDLPALTASYSGFVNGDTLETSGITGAPELSTTAVQSSPVGTFPISIAAANLAAANYNFHLINGTLTVTKAALTVTADNLVKVYGAPLPTFTASYSGFVNQDTPESLATPVTFSTTATLGSSVGTYDIVPQGALDANYTITFVKGTLEVTPAVITVQANDQTKSYGAALPGFTYQLSGLVNGDEAAVVNGTPDLGTPATDASDVGSYAINVRLGNLSAQNYTFRPVSATLTVTPAPLTVAAESTAKLYGAPLPVFTASYTGLVLGQSPSVLGGALVFTTSATSISPVGDYPIIPSGLTSANYRIAFVKGTLTVNPAPLTIIAEDQKKVYGAALPALTARYEGLVNGEDEDDLDSKVVLNTTATATSLVGTYPITAGGAADPNYAITFVNGTLEVTPVPLKASINNPPAAYVLPVGSSIDLSGSFTPSGLPSYEARWSLSSEGCDLTTPGLVNEADNTITARNVTFSAPGLYQVTLTVTDKANTSAQATMSSYVVVYDPNGGFVTGGGWIMSPAGAYKANPTLSGKVTFGFSSKYLKGATVPTGNSQFQFQVGNFKFQTTDLQWLVVAGGKAQFKGTGTANGTGNYGCLLTATDGQVNGGGGADKFRIKIWDTATSTIVYDNVQGAGDDLAYANPQAIAGGSIVIHKD